MSVVVSVAELIQEVRPFKGQDCQLVYRVRTDQSLKTDETITGWTLSWVLFSELGDTVAVLTKTTSSGISITTPYATVTITAANMDTLTAGHCYRMQLWRNDSGNRYPLTGVGVFTPQTALPLS